jgi:Tol biopolymer transport system component
MRIKRSLYLAAIIAIILPGVTGSICLSAVSAREATEIKGEAIGAVLGAPQSIAFTSNRDGNNEIYVMDPDGTPQTRKTSTLTAVNDQRPEISPDGSKIAFASNRDGNFEIFLMDFNDPSSLSQLTSTLAPVANSWPRWSPDGEWIAFQSGSGSNFQIFRVRPDGTDLTQITQTGDAALNQYPAWSPDGTRLAIRRNTEIYLINSADGADPEQLTATSDIPGAFNQMASFAPDGTRIAFFSNREGYGSVFIMDSDGSGQFNLTPRPDGRTTGWGSRAPAWSPNSELIYFTAVRSLEAGNSNEQIWVKPAGGGSEFQLTSDGVNSEATVRHIVAPTITNLVASPNILWPGYNMFVAVALTVGVTDNSDPAPVCEITDVTSNEDTLEPAWQVTGPLTLDLLAQRIGKLNGRVYTIEVTCTNSSGLSSSSTVLVNVPHDRRLKSNTDLY